MLINDNLLSLFFFFHLENSSYANYYMRKAIIFCINDSSSMRTGMYYLYFPQWFYRKALYRVPFYTNAFF
ncbi:MAG: hypothetical protein A2139_07230 [Desulfobacca sp. RBG_16_60_12]|nr:MAG: hypothetical protein A2139_07230 [Desulfobacca sp. RBG_16_60_12]